MKVIAIIAAFVFSMAFSAQAQDVRQITEVFKGTIIDNYSSSEERYCSKTAAAGGGFVGGASAGAAGGMMFGPIGAAIGVVGGGLFGIVGGWGASCQTDIVIIKREDGTMFELLNPANAHQYKKGMVVHVTVRDDGSSRIKVITK